VENTLTAAVIFPQTFYQQIKIEAMLIKKVVYYKELPQATFLALQLKKRIVL